MAHAKDNAPQVYNGVSEADVPSARFGWSAFTDRTIQIAGWISVLFLVAYNFGNHQGHVETIWLIALAVLIALADPEWGAVIAGFAPSREIIGGIAPGARIGRPQSAGHRLEPEHVHARHGSEPDDGERDQRLGLNGHGGGQLPPG